MKNNLTVLGVLFFLIFTKFAFAQEKPAVKLNISEMAKAAEMIKKYKMIAKNPESFKSFVKVAQSLKNKKDKN